MTDLNATPATLAKTLQGAAPGDTVRLAPGDYPKVRCKATPGIILTSADPAHRARFTGGLTLDQWADVRFQEIIFDITEAPTNFASAVRIYGGRALSFADCDFVGALKPNGERWGIGVNPSDVSGLVITRCRTNDLWKAFTFRDCQDVSVVDNDMTDIGSDGVNLGQCDRVLIARNGLIGFNPFGGDHPDGVQIMTTAALGACTDIEIVDNLIYCEPDKRTQGIFCRSENPDPAVRHRGLKIAGNVLVNAGWHGIGISSADDYEIVDNYLPFEVVPTNVAKMSWVRAFDGTGRVAGNRAMVVEAPGSSLTSDNTIIPAASADEAARAVSAWNAKFRAPAQPAEPAPEPPARDELRDLIAARTVVKQEPLKTKGRVTLDWKTPAEADAFLAAVQALRAAA